MLLIQELNKRGFEYRHGSSGPTLRYDGIIIPVSMLQAESMRMDASQRLAFGLCKKYGIDLPKGATPKDAWQALNEKTGKTPGDFYSSSGEKGADKIRFGNTGTKKFAKALEAAKKSRDPKDAWRVTGMEKEELEKSHPGAKLHITDGGSTIAIDKSGDIIGVCVGSRDGKKGFLPGKALIAHAVKNGGIKLDSYEGNHEFYVKCGFEPVSWCKWEPRYEDDAKKQGWDPKRDRREDIVFYRFVGAGKVKNTDLDSFKQNIPVSIDYDAAYAARDKTLKKKR